MSLASGWGVQPLALWTVCSTVTTSCTNRRKQHPLNTCRLFNKCVCARVCVCRWICVIHQRAEEDSGHLCHHWKDPEISLQLTLHSYPPSPFCNRVEASAPLGHFILHLNCILQPCQKAIPFITAVCIHHPPFVSLLPSWQLNATEVLMCTFCPQLFSWSLTSPFFKTTFSSFLQQQFQAGGNATITTTKQPSSNLTSFPLSSPSHGWLLEKLHCEL